jgi:hypothetical protein
MPSVADMTEKTLDPAHIVVGRSPCNEIISTRATCSANSSKVSCADPRATPEDYFQLKAGGN